MGGALPNLSSPGASCKMLRRSGPKQDAEHVDTGACHKHKVSLQVGCKFGSRHQLWLRQCSYDKRSGNWMMLYGSVRQ